MKKLIFAIFCLLCGLSASAQDNLERGRNYYEMQRYQEALPLLQAAAKEGFGEACYLLGQMYDYGLGAAKNYDVALRMYQRGLEYGYGLGESELGVLYEFGQGCEADPRKAVACYEKSHARGLLPGTYQLARCCYFGIGMDAADDAKAFAMFTALVANDDCKFDYPRFYRNANRILGECYQKGFGTAPDPKKAVIKYYESRNPRALYEAARLVHDFKLPAMGYEYSLKNLMDMAFEGGLQEPKAFYDYAACVSEENPDWSVEHLSDRDLSGIFGLLHQVAEGNYGPAQKLLGDWYKAGRGTAVNLVKAREWYAKAKANGEEVPEL